MRRSLTLALLSACVLLFSACASGKLTALRMYRAGDYQEHRQTNWIRVHWNITRPDDKTVVAEGFVEPFSPANGVFAVELKLVGLDDDGREVNSASGRPADFNIASPFDYSPFSIKMELDGKEKDFTISGSYYHYVAGTRPVFQPEFYDTIPLKSDEPY